MDCREKHALNPEAAVVPLAPTGPCPPLAANTLHWAGLTGAKTKANIVLHIAYAPAFHGDINRRQWPKRVEKGIPCSFGPDSHIRKLMRARNMDLATL
jgi:hypothetical protein